MNFCQINVSEYFVIANDAQHIKIKKKREEKGGKNGTKLDPGVRRERARLYKIFGRERLFGNFYVARLRMHAFAHVRLICMCASASPAIFSRCIFFLRRLYNNHVTFSIIAERLMCWSLLRSKSRIATTTTTVYDRISNRAVLCAFATEVV